VQDYLFVEAAVPFLGVLLAKAPARLRPPLADAIVGLHRELALFRQQAAQHRVVLAEHEMAPSCHAYVQFLMASAYGEPLEAGLTVLYAAEQAYLDAWTQVREAQRGPSPWQAFIDNWTSPGFHSYVDWLAATLDELATQTSAADRVAMERLVLLTARYEYLFWEMAQSQQRWPV
jgi:thiaminase/transcriptional activator TenA